MDQFFAAWFFFFFLIYIKFPMFLKKNNEPHRSSISELTVSERCVDLNV